MYSLRLQYYIGDALVTDIRTFDKLAEVNDYVMDFLDDDNKRLQAMRVVHESGKD